jgi:hypothetical protein
MKLRYTLHPVPYTLAPQQYRILQKLDSKEIPHAPS